MSLHQNENWINDYRDIYLKHKLYFNPLKKLNLLNEFQTNNIDLNIPEYDIIVTRNTKIKKNNCLKGIIDFFCCTWMTSN